MIAEALYFEIMAVIGRCDRFWPSPRQRLTAIRHLFHKAFRTWPPSCSAPASDTGCCSYFKYRTELQPARAALKDAIHSN